MSVSVAASTWAVRAEAPSVGFTPASASASQQAMPLNDAPRIISMCVGLHMVTSMP